MQIRTSNPNDFPAINNIPGYPMSRKMFDDRRDIDLKVGKGNFLDDIGEVYFLDWEHVFVIPATELKYIPADVLSAIPYPRLTKTVITQDGLLLTVNQGHVDTTWLQTFLRVASVKGNDHFVKCFAPTNEGPVKGYHAVRTADNRLNTKVFGVVNGLQIGNLDLVQHEGRVNLGVITYPTFQCPKPTVLLRETPLKALKDETNVDSNWTPAPWARDINVTSLRGFVKDGMLTYTYLDDKGNFYMTRTTDTAAKLIKKNVRGTLVNVSGTPFNLSQDIVFTDDQILAIGDKDQVIGEYTNPVFAEFGRMIRQGNILRGIHGKEAIFASIQGNPQFDLMVAKTPSVQAVA